MFGRNLVVSLFLVLCLAAPGRAGTAAKKVLLVGQGPDGHPATTHEYLAGLRVLARCLEKVPGLEVTTVRADEPWKEGPELLARADAVVLFLAEGAKWAQHDPERQEALERVAARKGGLVALHWAMGTRDARPINGFVNLLGGCHGGPDRKYKVLEKEEDARVADAAHPVTAGVKDFRVRDEFYYRLKFAKEGVKPLLRVRLDGEDETVAWAWERPDGGRSFGFSGLHFHDNWKLPEYRRLVTQGVLWTLQVPIPKDGVKVDVADKDLKLK